MDNLQQPAFPLPIALHSNGSLQDTSDFNPTAVGFIKLEYAAILIIQGMLANPSSDSLTQIEISQTAVRLAKAVLEEANK